MKSTPCFMLFSCHEDREIMSADRGIDNSVRPKAPSFRATGNRDAPLRRLPARVLQRTLDAARFGRAQQPLSLAVIRAADRGTAFVRAVARRRTKRESRWTVAPRPGTESPTPRVTS